MPMEGAEVVIDGRGGIVVLPMKVEPLKNARRDRVRRLSVERIYAFF